MGLGCRRLPCPSCTPTKHNVYTLPLRLTIHCSYTASMLILIKLVSCFNCWFLKLHNESHCNFLYIHACNVCSTIFNKSCMLMYTIVMSKTQWINLHCSCLGTRGDTFHIEASDPSSLICRCPCDHSDCRCMASGSNLLICAE